jgi:Heparinase II/III N-terminus
MRGAFRLTALTAATLVVAIAVAGCDDDASTQSPDMSPAQTAHCPPRPSIELPRVSEAELSRASEGVFDVYGFRTRLEPPIDWAMNPHGSLRFQAYLSNWTFLDPLLAGYRSTGDPRHLRQAAEIAIDWIASNPREDPAGGAGTWSGKVAGDRAQRLAYLLAAAGCPGGLSAAQIGELEGSLREHVAILQGPESAGATNHALYVQLGLAAVAAQLPQLPEASTLRATAERRFRRVLEGRLAG